MTDEVWAPDTEWGPWKLDPNKFVLGRVPAGVHSYPIDLLTCRDSAEVLDWICQAAGRYRDDFTLVGLVRALNDVLTPQANLCSAGQSTRLSEKQLQKQITAAADRIRAEKRNIGRLISGA